MSKKVETVRIGMKDFQPFEDAVVTATGLTVVCGENNVGKTSVFRAVESVVNNSRHGDKDIRWGSRNGQSEVSVAVDFDDGGVVVVREKPAKGGARYLVNGDVYEAVGRVPVEDVRERLQMQPLQTRLDSHQPHFQRSRQMFAVDLSPSRLFDLVNELMPQREVVSVLADMKTVSGITKKNAEALAAAAASELATAAELEDQVQQLSGPDDGQDLRQQLQDELAAYGLETQGLEKAVAVTESAKTAADQCQSLQKEMPGIEEKLGEATSQLELTKSSVTAITQARQSQTKLDKLDGWIKGFSQALTECGAGVDEVNGIGSGEAAAAAVSRAKTVTDIYNRIQMTVLELTPALNQIKTAMTETAGWAGEHEQVVAVAEALDRARRREEEEQQLQIQIQQAQQDLAEVEKERGELEREGRHCESCGAPVDDEGHYCG